MQRQYHWKRILATLSATLAELVDKAVGQSVKPIMGSGAVIPGTGDE